MGVDYYSYIQSDEWRQRANEAKRRAGYRCQVCNRSSRDVTLDAHHRTYDRLGNEAADDITVLCRDCHELYELHGRPPQKPSKQIPAPLTPQAYTSPVWEKTTAKPVASVRPIVPVQPVNSLIISSERVPTKSQVAIPITQAVGTTSAFRQWGLNIIFLIVGIGLLYWISFFSFFMHPISPKPDPTSTLALAASVATVAIPPTKEVSDVPVNPMWTNPIDDAVYVHIPAGEFVMGSSDAEIASAWELCKQQYKDCESYWFELELPQSRVFVDEFWIMQTEVTNKQYALCVAAEVCTAPGIKRWNDASYADHPVISVDWNQAKTYAEWVGGRLPTEAEWEKACRGTDTRVYPWGDETPTYEQANFAYNWGDTSPVGSYSPGVNKLYDMAGNVWEWTSSKFEAYPYNASDGREGPGKYAERMLRGGAWSYIGINTRCASRFKATAPSNSVDFGFRIVALPSGQVPVATAIATKVTMPTPQPTSRPTLTPLPTATLAPPTATPRPVTPTDTPRPIQPTATPPARGCPGGCTTYPTWCEVVIKGNVSYNTGERIYHVPGQEYYSDTVINTQYGERWFCTEQEARAAGWRKSRR